jgi:hypothetical protein
MPRCLTLALHLPDEDPTSTLPNTGTGIITGDDQSALMIVLGFASVSALLCVAGLRTARRS